MLSWLSLFFRFSRILYIGWRFHCVKLIVSALKRETYSCCQNAEALRSAFESLGPIFIKLGQLIATRGDLFPEHIVLELTKLQQNVTPVPTPSIINTIEKELGQPLSKVFLAFDPQSLASASVAQVHVATLTPALAMHWPQNPQVVVKVLKPGIKKIIKQDLALMRFFAYSWQLFSPKSLRFRLPAVIDELAFHLQHELNLHCEAANASQIKRNFLRRKQLLVPEIFWPLCRQNMMVMEYMQGIPISDIEALTAAKVDLPQLARSGVEIFFTQVFCDGFFHADMHPGNILVSIAPETHAYYIALDFGIVGALSAVDQEYLAKNLLAFFNRDYRRVAELHVQSGWVAENTRVEAFEFAIRTVCEPYFSKPLQDIPLGLILMRFFQISQQFDMQIQPQLILLQKTLLQIESLGRKIDSQLDLWGTAKPFLEQWLKRQLGLQGFWMRLRKEAPYWLQYLPQMPRLTHELLQDRKKSQNNGRKTQNNTKPILFFIAGTAVASILLKCLDIFNFA